MCNRLHVSRSSRHRASLCGDQGQTMPPVSVYWNLMGLWCESCLTRLWSLMAAGEVQFFVIIEGEKVWVGYKEMRAMIGLRRSRR